jgi:hypothetical protein
MDRLPLTRATTLIFIGKFPTVYPSHSLSPSLFKILVPHNQKLEISYSYCMDRLPLARATTLIFTVIFLTLISKNVTFRSLYPYNYTLWLESLVYIGNVVYI